MLDVIKKDDFIKRYSKMILQNKVAVFLGAGINVEVGLPTWIDLLRDIFEDLKLEVKENIDLALIAQFYINEKGSERELLNIISEKINLQNKKPGKNLTSLTRLPIQQFWTTNYDDLLEKALNNENKKYDSIYNKKQFYTACRKYSIFKIHGDILNKEYLVFSKDSYDLYEKDRKFFWDKLSMELINKNFLFIGTSMEDTNLNLILSKVNMNVNKEDKSEHFIFLKDIKEHQKFERMFLQHKIKDLKTRFNIKTVLLEDYSELSEIFNSINSLILRKNIFISGAAYSYKEFDNEINSKTFLYNLANELCKKQKKIISGFGLGVSDLIISGAVDYSKDNGTNLEEILDVWPFPQQSKKHDINQIWNDYRNKIIEKSGVIIFVFGNKFDKKHNKIINSQGMMEEFEIAKSQNKIIILIGSTGYMSKEILDLIIKDIKDFKYLKDYLTILKSEKDYKKIVSIIVEILNKRK
ncbi:SIR2 family protein [Spiroplasma endosymbiont of Nebria brevicollis]|uniref:SIR2 family protein n=1 Tax=Spiroplasma endosymbiont of Nebria brevicollis TaxID=3066284 RepID=UPI00313B5209